MKAKQVVIVIVEGMSDKTVLAGLLPKMFDDYVYRFKIVHGDLLTQTGMSRDRILGHVNRQIAYVMNEYKYRADDIKEIIHLVDLDAVYLDQAHIEERPNIARIVYRKKTMYVKDLAQILTRNAQKTRNLMRLLEATFIRRGAKRIPYALYYMSINLDHVIGENPNLGASHQKAELSYRFVERFRGHEHDFIPFTKQCLARGSEDYMSSWQVAQTSEWALRRMSNLYYYLVHAGEKSPPLDGD